MQFEKAEINGAIARAMQEPCRPPADYLNSEADLQRFIAWGEDLLELFAEPEMDQTYSALQGRCGKAIALVSALGLMNSAVA